MIPRLGEMAALGAVVSWTFTALFFEAAGHRIGSLVVNLLRLLFALLYFLIAMLVVHGEPVPLHAPAMSWVWLGLSAVFGFLLGDGALFRSIVVLGSRRAITIMALVPPITALIAWVFMGETLAWFEWLGMAITIAGVVMVVLDRKGRDQEQPDHVHFSGVALGVLGAIGQAVGLVFSKKGMLEGLDAFRATQIRVIFGAILFSALFFAIRWWPKVREGLRDRRALGFTAGGAFFGPFIGVTLSLLAVRYTEAGVAATIMALTPVTMIPAVVLLQKEKVHASGYVGAALAVGGVALMFLR